MYNSNLIDLASSLIFRKHCANGFDKSKEAESAEESKLNI
jgi:hypothetical protein